MLEDSQRRARGVGADIMVRGSNASSVVSFSGATISEKHGRISARRSPHVKLAMGVIIHPIETAADRHRHRPRRSSIEMSGGFTYLEGGPLQGPDDILVDQYYAAREAPARRRARSS